MAGPGTFFTGPVGAGFNRGAANDNTGLVVLRQVATLTQNGASTVNATLYLPTGAQIVDILADTTTAWNSGTSDTLSVGVSSGDGSFASGVTGITSTGRIRPTFTATQLGNMANIANTSNIVVTQGSAAVVVTVTPSGTAATTGSTTVTVLYVETVQLSAGVT